MAHGGIKSEHRSQKADVREGCCTTFSDLLVAFPTALLSKAKVTQPNPSKPTGVAGSWIGHDQPTQVPALPTVTWVGQAQTGAPLLCSRDFPLPFSALGPIFPDPHHWPCGSDHLLWGCPPWSRPSSVSQVKQRNRWMGPAKRPGTAVPAAFSCARPAT